MITVVEIISMKVGIQALWSLIQKTSQLYVFLIPGPNFPEKGTTANLIWIYQNTYNNVVYPAIIQQEFMNHKTLKQLV